MRSYAPGFIFTTALPPAICAAATAAIRHLKTSSWERERHQDRAARVKAVLTAAGLPVMPNDTHIVPVFVGDPEKCKQASDLLLDEHGIYIQPINYPTVPKGTERLRITPSPYHDDALIDALAEALLEVWERLGLPLRKQIAGGRVTLSADRHLAHLVPHGIGPAARCAAAAQCVYIRPRPARFRRASRSATGTRMLHDWVVIAAAFGYIGLLFVRRELRRPAVAEPARPRRHADLSAVAGDLLHLLDLLRLGRARLPHRLRLPDASMSARS